MGAVDRRPHLHGDGRQPAIRLDAVRRPHRRQVRLEQGRDPGHLHHLRPARDVASARGRVPGRSVRSKVDDRRRRRALRPRLDDQFLRRFPGDVLFRRGARRHRRRCRVRHVYRQCREMVPRSARARGGSDRGRLRRRFGGDHHPDRQHDQELGLRAHLPDLRPVSGHRRRDRRPADPRPVGEFLRGGPEAEPRRKPLPGEAARDAQGPGLLGDVCHVHHDGGRRSDGDRTARAHRQGLQGG